METWVLPNLSQPLAGGVYTVLLVAGDVELAIERHEELLES